jgi:hypothetical protein
MYNGQILRSYSGEDRNFQKQIIHLYVPYNGQIWRSYSGEDRNFQKQIIHSYTNMAAFWSLSWVERNIWPSNGTLCITYIHNVINQDYKLMSFVSHFAKSHFF